MKYASASVLIVLMALTACKSPTAPTTLTNPLTITVPDSAREFDTVLLCAHDAD